jgi:hypothetical protein
MHISTLFARIYAVFRFWRNCSVFMDHKQVVRSDLALQ